MRVLAIDHFFGQDLDALGAANPGHEMVVIHASVLHDLARRVFPSRTFAGLDGYARPGLGVSRALYALAIKCFLARVRKDFTFDLLVVPSDSIFYLREPIHALREAGTPTVVVQKETGMSPWAIESHARETARYAPFMADAMTVNSQLHRGFWLTAGARSEQITVTGQPRFDYYASVADRREAKKALGLPVDEQMIVFLSYMLSAYVPGERDTWAEQRRATELALIRQCAESGALLAVKPHPQQPVIGYSEELAAAASDLGAKVRMIDPNTDTRVLLSAADVVVGFQSTAMYEAVAAGAPTIYAGWAPEATEIDGQLLPVSRVGPAVLVARSAEHLGELVSKELRDPTPIDRSAALRAAEEQLGPLDGGACARVWAVLERFGAADAV